MKSIGRTRCRVVLASVAVAVAVVVVAGCGANGTPTAAGPSTPQESSSGGSSPSSTTQPTPDQTPDQTPEQTPEPLVDASFPVGSHQLAIRCYGTASTGSPTVVYLHGYIHDANGGGAINAGRIPGLVAAHTRICVYDRANVGASGKTSGRQTGADSVRDLHTLFTAASLEPPYVLLGASFGGLIAYQYALTYPHDVAGMVLLDASLPDDLEVERRVVGADKVAPVENWRDTLEQLDQAATYAQAQALADSRTEPAIPVTYLAAESLDLPPWYPAEAFTTAVRTAQQQFVDQFKPGRLDVIDTPHYMEPEIPDKIAEEVQRVIDASPR